MTKQPKNLKQWPADQTERWTLDKIKPYPRNARIHSAEQIELIADSIQRYGFTAPLLVDEGGVLIYGHGRYAAAMKLKLDSVPVAIAHGWTEEEQAAYRIADNQLALRSEWDVPLLEAEIKELTFADFELTSLGFSEAQLAALTMPVISDPLNEWRGMPEFQQDDQTPFRSIRIHFADQQAVNAFAELLKRDIPEKALFLWYPVAPEKPPWDKTYESSVPDLHTVEGPMGKPDDDKGTRNDEGAIPRRSRRTRTSAVRNSNRPEKTAGTG